MRLHNTEILESVVNLLWGNNPSSDVFKRWSQGFLWSETEPLALLQHFGGPCSVIAPVQAFFLKRLLFMEERPRDQLPIQKRPTIEVSIPEAEKVVVFVDTLVEILLKLNTSSWIICSIDESLISSNSVEETKEADIQIFHQILCSKACHTRTELEETIKNNCSQFFSMYGVLLFVYSAILSRGVDIVRNEHDNPGRPMIEAIYGHGGQSLLNLMLNGEAVENVFDGYQDLSGLRLQGINGPCKVGFLSLMEQLKYCTVGDSLKRPQFPVWVIGSETHYSVVFSTESRLVAPRSPKNNAEKVFNQHAEDESGFIQSFKLSQLLDELNLESQQDYVDLMLGSLDPDGLGIIFLHDFLREFFSEEDKPTLPTSFDIFFYNGLVQSSANKQVCFRKGTASVFDWNDHRLQTSDSAIEGCLQMRFPGMTISWKDGKAPSIN